MRIVYNSTCSTRLTYWQDCTQKYKSCQGFLWGRGMGGKQYVRGHPPSLQVSPPLPPLPFLEPVPHSWKNFAARPLYSSEICLGLFNIVWGGEGSERKLTYIEYIYFPHSSNLPCWGLYGGGANQEFCEIIELMWAAQVWLIDFQIWQFSMYFTDHRFAL